MATITYRCSVCERQIDLIEHKNGLTSFGKCIITEGCRGKLFQIKRNINNIREKFPPEVIGLNDYIPRNNLYNYTQNIPSNKWVINHNLNTSPTVSVYVYDTNNNLKLLKKDQYKITTITENKVELELDSVYTGKVQLLNRTTYKTTPKIQTVQESTVQATVGGTFVFAIPKYLTNYYSPPQIRPIPSLPYDLKDKQIRIEVSLLKPNQEEEICNEIFSFNINSTPWIGWNEVLFKKRRNYYLLSKNILDFKILGLSNPTFKDIPDNTIVKFTKIDYGTGIFQPVDTEGLFCMLTAPPYDSNDKLRNKVIDVGNMINNTNDGFTFKTNEFYVNSTSVDKIYPEVLKV